MTRFRFRAVNGKGDIVEGEVEASARDAVIDQLRRREQMPLSIEPAGTAEAGQPLGLMDRLNQPLWAGRPLKPRDLTVMTREFSTLLGAGLTVDQSLRFLSDVAARKPQRKLFDDLLDKVQGGSPLADALADHPEMFSPVYVSLVRAGEAGNALGDVLSGLADYLERSERLRQEVQSALVYPIMLLVMACLSVAILLLVVLPQFTPMFESAGAELPWLTRMVVLAGDAAQAYWLPALALVAALALWLVSRFRQPASRVAIDRWILGLPLVGPLIAKIDTARLTRTVGTLLIQGVALPHALSIAQNVLGNAALRQSLGTTLGAVKEGKGLADSLGHSGTFPPLAIHLIAVGERSGQLDPMLMKVADILDQEVQVTIGKLMTLLVPALTIGVGLIIAIIIGAILSAILAAYQLPL